MGAGQQSNTAAPLVAHNGSDDTDHAHIIQPRLLVLFCAIRSADWTHKYVDCSADMMLEFSQLMPLDISLQCHIFAVNNSLLSGVESSR